MSSLELKASMAPYVEFQYRPVEDREATQKNGTYTARDVAFVLVTPPGSKDRYEYVADDWFADLKREVGEKRFPQDWFDLYKRQFQAWKNNEEIPLEGTPIKNWGLASPAQRNNLISCGVVTVEQLAVANEELIGRLGMGGRTLVERAKDFVSQRDTGKTVLTVEAMKKEFDALKLTNQRLTEQNENLQSLVKELRGSPAKPVEAPKDDDFKNF